MLAAACAAHGGPAPVLFVKGVQLGRFAAAAPQTAETAGNTRRISMEVSVWSHIL